VQVQSEKFSGGNPPSPEESELPCPVQTSAVNSQLEKYSYNTTLHGILAAHT